MKNFGSSVVNFLKEEDGPTAVEYAIMLMCIIMVCIVGALSVGTATNDSFEQFAEADW